MNTKPTVPWGSIQEKIAQNPSYLLSREQVEHVFGIPKRWLELAAWRQTGPPMVKISRRMVRYRASDIQTWVEQRCTSVEDI